MDLGKSLDLVFIICVCLVMAMLLPLLLNNSWFSCPRKVQFLLLEKNRHQGLKSSVKLLFWVLLLNDKHGNPVALRKPTTTHGQLCSSHLSRPACIASAAKSSSQQMADLSFLLSSTINYLTFHHLHSLKYIFIFTKPVFLSSTPQRGRHPPITITPPGKRAAGSP